MPPLHPRAHACGKVIVMGEHAVVYGYPALAAGVPAALTLRARRLDDPTAPMRLSIPAWNLDLDLLPDVDHPVARAALEVIGFCDGPLHGYAIEGEADLPAGAGLGSSAALTVALARLVLGPDADPEILVEASMQGERIFHGQPSGIDSQVAARGGLLRFVRGETPEPVMCPAEFSIVVVPSGIERRTAEQVANVRARYERVPTVIRPVLDAIGIATGEAIDAIAKGDRARLGELMDIAHGLLGAIGVSSPALDELCSTARSAGALGAKLTGAGGGGCILCATGPDPSAVLHAFTTRGLRPLIVRPAT